MTSTAKQSTWAEIDLQAIAGNVGACLRLTGVPVMAVVKANAYGHGSLAVARAALAAGATWCGVARADEALELRRAGVTAPTLVLGLTPPAAVSELVAAGVSLTVWTAEQIEVAAAAGRDSGAEARLHLKIDTGMGRLGVQPEAALNLARHCAASPGARLEGLFTHFARADEDDPAPSLCQERRLAQAVEALAAAGLRPKLVHAANSAAALRLPSARLDLVRLGIAMYGLPPSNLAPLPDPFRPALAWKARMSQVKTLPAGQGLGYGHAYVTRGEERIGTLPVGYGDGFRREPGNQVLVGGRRVPVVGKVCMDQVMVRLNDVPQASEGDEVVVLGAQGGERISAEDLAKRWGTINYEVVCAIAARVPRVYLT